MAADVGKEMEKLTMTSRGMLKIVWCGRRGGKKVEEEEEVTCDNICSNLPEILTCRSDDGPVRDAPCGSPLVTPSDGG